MEKVIYVTSNFHNKSLASLAVMVGSFDCLHRGHEWCMEKLMERHENLLLLIPLRHPEKRLGEEGHARLCHRVEMLKTCERKSGGHMEIGLAREALFIKLYEELSRKFSLRSVHFGLGSDTFMKAQASRDYYHHSGYAWTGSEESTLHSLLRDALVVDRSLSHPGHLHPPPELAPVSSSLVRRMARQWWQSGKPELVLYSLLEGMVSPEITRLILEWGLYRVSEKNIPGPESAGTASAEAPSQSIQEGVTS